MLPVATLVQPPDPLLVRNTSKDFIDTLNHEMLNNQTSNVQPILCLVCLKDGDEFVEKYKEAYVYHTIGGNHSRQALQELLEEHPIFNQKRIYTHRLCSVYGKMPRNLALRLASKHNRAGTFHHDITTWEKVKNCVGNYCLKSLGNQKTLRHHLNLRHGRSHARQFYHRRYINSVSNK